MKTLILGYGNTLRNDDGFGVYAIEALTATTLSADVEVLACHQLSPEMSVKLAQAEHAIFIDVALAANGENSGIIKTRELHPRATRTSGITHHFDPETLLTMAETLYGHAPQAALFSVTADNFDLKEGLSPEVDAALPVLVENIKEYLFALSQN